MLSCLGLLNPGKGKRTQLRTPLNAPASSGAGISGLHHCGLLRLILDFQLLLDVFFLYFPVTFIVFAKKAGNTSSFRIGMAFSYCWLDHCCGGNTV